MVAAHRVSTEWHQSFNSCVVASYALAARGLGVQRTIDEFLASFATEHSLANPHDLPREQIIANYFDHSPQLFSGTGLQLTKQTHDVSQHPGFADARNMGIITQWISSAASIATNGLSTESLACVAYLIQGLGGQGVHCVVLGQDSGEAWIYDPNFAMKWTTFPSLTHAISSLGPVQDGLLVSLTGHGKSATGPGLAAAQPGHPPPPPGVSPRDASRDQP